MKYAAKVKAIEPASGQPALAPKINGNPTIKNTNAERPDASPV